jgi:hypothetical protein
MNQKDAKANILHFLRHGIRYPFIAMDKRLGRNRKILRVFGIYYSSDVGSVRYLVHDYWTRRSCGTRFLKILYCTRSGKEIGKADANVI